MKKILLYLLVIFFSTSMFAERLDYNIFKTKNEAKLLSTVDLTFSVDMSQYTAAFTTVYLNGTFNNCTNWNGTSNPLTNQGNGIWSITITVPENDSIEYKFMVDGWRDQEIFTGNEPCTKTTGGFTNRFLAYGTTDVTLNTVCWNDCNSCFVAPPLIDSVDLTFTVDLSQYTGTFTTAYINGTFNNWNGTTNPLNNLGNGLWAGTITVPENDSLEYKFTLDGWNAQENFSGGESCTKTTGGFTNRFLTYGNVDLTLDTVCFNSCSACQIVATPDSVEITFLVNTANITVDAAGIFLAGGLDFGVPGDNPMTDANGDGVWEITITKPKGISGHYIFTNGNCPNWACKENLAGLPCADAASFNDRILPLIWNDTIIMTCFESCSADTTCPAPPATVDLTFGVDLSQYTGTFTTAYINGTFNNWNGTANPLTNNGNGIWTTTLTLPENDSLEYKFTLDGWTAQENFVGGESCTKTSFGFTNRFLAYGNTNMTIPTVCWESCAACVPVVVNPDSIDISFTVDMSQYTGTFTTAYINGTFNNWNGTANPLNNLGNGLWAGTITVPENDSLEYKFTLDGWNAQENFSGGESCTKTTGGFTNRFLTYGNVDLTLDTVCFNSCSACQIVIIPDSIDITFTVDLSQYTGTFTTAYINGTFNNWNGTANPLTDNGNGIWTTTLTVHENDSLEYKFTLDGWNAQENFNGGESCTKTTGGFTNRFLTYGNVDLTLDTVCFNSCSACQIVATPDSVEITFLVNTANITVDAAGIFLAGGLDFGVPGDNPMTDANGDGVWEITITKPQGISGHYIFTNGNCPNWACKENLAGLPCADAASFNDRILPLIWNDTIIMTCFESCSADTTCPAPPATVDLTFGVDLSQYTGTFTTAYINGSFNNWNGTANPLTDNGNGIWTTTLTVTENDSLEYKFTLDGWTAQENFSGGESCTKTSFGFTNRFLAYGNTNMTIPTVCWESCAACVPVVVNPDSIDISFTVDMSQYQGTFTTAYINGTFNNWSGTTNPLTDNGNGIWTTTLTLPENDSLEYKFTLDGWNAQENFNGGESCTKTTGGFTNRFLTYGNVDLTLDTVCFNSCSACQIVTTPDSVDITFLVNTANITVDAAGIFLAGGGIFGNPGDNPMTDANGDGVWEITITKPQGISGHYIFTNGNCPNWACKENLAGLPCADAANFNDRILPLIWNDTIIMTCFESCSADTVCPAPPATVDLTFGVDLSQYTGTFTTAYINGSFNNWNGTANPLTDNGNGIWTTTLTVTENDSLEYKFTLDGWNAQENFVGGESCTKTSFGFTNRFLAYGNTNMTIPTVCWESCAACVPVVVNPDSVDITFTVDMSQYVGTFTTAYINGTFNNWSGTTNPLTDNGNGIWTTTLTLPENDSIEYKFTLDGWTAQENFNGGESCTKTTGGFTNRFLTYGNVDLTLDTVCFNSCSACQIVNPVNTVDLTFTVDMSQYTGTFTAAYINGSFNNWNGTTNPLTDNGNGIWTTTLTLPENDSLEYKFTLDGWTAQENFVGGESCTKTSFGFTNRFLAYGNTNMTIPTVCWESCAACVPIVVNPDSIDITFTVDMSQYQGTFTTAYINGTFNNWSGTTNPLTDNGNGIWTTTLTLPENDSLEYKFTLDGWTAQENFNGGESCTKTTGGFTNRFLTYGNVDLTLDTVCFNSCSACVPIVVIPDSVNVTFVVDMHLENTNANGVFLGASFDNWSGNLAMSDMNNDSIWEVTVLIPANAAYEYKFINGANWVSSEQFDPASADSICTITNGNNTNRILTVTTADTTTITYCYNHCEDCQTVGVRPVLSPVDFQMTPNPANNYVRLTFNNQLVNTAKTVSIHNGVGQMIFNQTVNNVQFYDINTQNMSAGMYLITMQTEDGVLTKPLIVSH